MNQDPSPGLRQMIVLEDGPLHILTHTFLTVPEMANIKVVQYQANLIAAGPLPQVKATHQAVIHIHQAAVLIHQVAHTQVMLGTIQIVDMQVLNLLNGQVFVAVQGTMIDPQPIGKVHMAEGHQIERSNHGHQAVGVEKVIGEDLPPKKTLGLQGQMVVERGEKEAGNLLLGGPPTTMEVTDEMTGDNRKEKRLVHGTKVAGVTGILGGIRAPLTEMDLVGVLHPHLLVHLVNQNDVLLKEVLAAQALHPVACLDSAAVRMVEAKVAAEAAHPVGRDDLSVAWQELECHNWRPQDQPCDMGAGLGISAQA